MMDDVVKVVDVSRPVAAPEWCMREGLAIATRYLKRGDPNRFKAAADIAEAIANAVTAAKRRLL